MSASLLGFGVGLAVVIPATIVCFARRVRALFAADLHELRQSLTAARLMIDLTVAFADPPAEGMIAAAGEMERSYAVLADFEKRFYDPGLILPSRLRDSARRLCGRGTVNVREEARRLAAIWGSATRALCRDFDFRWECGEVHVRGTRRHLTEALANLLANAIRHGEGRVTLVARRRGGLLRIEVADEGPGLERPIASIVGRGGRVGRRLGPHGHGLAVVVRATRHLGGAVCSAPSARGALFVVELPIADVRADYEQLLPPEIVEGGAEVGRRDSRGEVLWPAGVIGDDS